MAKKPTQRDRVSRLVVLKSTLKSERGYPMPSATAIARMEAEYAQVSKAIIDELVAARERRYARIMKKWQK